MTPQTDNLPKNDIPAGGAPAAPMGAPSPLDSLPFDVWTLAKGVWSWKWIFVVGTVLSVFAAAGVSYLFAPQYWTAEAVLLYHEPSDEALVGLYEDPGIGTHIKMIKVEPVLGEARKRVQLGASISQIAGACTVDNPKGTELVHIRFKWNEPTVVEPMATEIATIFKSHQAEMRRKEYLKITRKLEERKSKLGDKLNGYKKATEGVRAAAEWQQELDSLQTRIARTDMQFENATEQVTSFKATITLLEEELRTTIEKMSNSVGDRANSESLSNLNMRSGRIREKITMLKTEKINEIDEGLWAEQLSYLERGLARGFISDADFNSQMASREKFLAQTTDTPQEQSLREELDAIYEKMLNTGNRDPSSNESVRRIEDQLSDYRLKMQATAATIEEIDKRQSKYKSIISEHREQEPYQPLNSGRLLMEWQTELDDVDDRIDGIRALMRNEGSDFEYITKPEPPMEPSSSMRKVMFIAFSGMGPIGLLALAVGAQLLDTRIKSGAEIKFKLKQKLLGSLPDIGQSSQVSAEGWEGRLFEPIRSMARRIRAELPLEQSKILIVSAGRNEGATTLSLHLARCLGQQGEAVTLVDGAIRDGAVENDLRQLVLADGEEPDGLGDYLAGNVDDIEQIVWPTTLFGVNCVPSSQFGIVPELLGSRRMKEIIDEIVEDQNVLIIDGPPISESSDAEILCGLVDAVIIVVEAVRFRSQGIKRSIQRIKDTGVPIMGVVLNKVPPLYVESQWK